MKIVGARIVPFVIPFRGPLYAGSKVLRQRQGWLLELRDETGNCGVGEAAPRPGLGGEQRQELGQDLRNACGAVTDRAASFETLLGQSRRARYGTSRAAIEMALYDLEATSRGQPVADLLGDVRRRNIPVNALVANDWAYAAAMAQRSGFGCLKLKVDGRNMQASCDGLGEVRETVGDEMKIRVDLNCSWTVEEAMRWIPRLAAYGIEYVEQPVETIDELARVRAAVDVPLAADESVTDAAAVRSIATARAADVIVVKPALVGLSEANAMVRAAKDCGLDVVVTSTLDSSVGIAAALHLAATLPDPIRHCGLATAELLGADLVHAPLLPSNGSLALPEGVGLGVQVEAERLDRCRFDQAERLFSC